MTLPDINFHDIRGYGTLGSKAEGFEELATELLENAILPWPDGTRFERFGNPDGGREGRATLPSGDTWAWQAKYLFGLNASAYAQIDRSVRRAISREPRLKKYFVICPYDLPAGDTEEARSAHTKWEEHVSTWVSEAEKAGLSVEFEYVGLHALTKALTRPDNAGRLRYWFDTASFTPEWFLSITSRAVANSGPRYTPELHVGLPISDVFEALGRTKKFEHAIRVLLGRIRSARRYGFRAPEGSAEHFDQLITTADAALDLLDSQLAAAATSARGIGNLPDPRSALSAAEGAVEDLERKLYERHPPSEGYFIGDAAMLYSTIRRIGQALGETRQLLHGPPWAAADGPVLLLTGDAGTGKTHLMCDVAERRARESLPTLMVLGEEFDGRAPLIQLAELVGFDGPPEELLAALDAAAEAAGEVGLIMVDALNEGDDPRMWHRSLAGFVQDVIRHSYLKLAVSCRTQFVEHVVPEVVMDSAVRVVHRGFAEAPDAALARYVEAYGIQRPSFPMLEPEFTNPLFLKLVCTTLRERGDTQFPRDGVALTWLYRAYLEAIDARLSAPSRCDYDPHDRLASRAVHAIAAEMAESGSPPRRQKAKELSDGLLPGRGWDRSLLKGLLDEGVLAASIHQDEDWIHFGYERLGDVAVATMVARLPRDQAEAEGRRLAQRWWGNAGWLEALAITLPDAHGIELVDVLGHDAEVPEQAIRDFVTSLVWRAPESISERTIEHVRVLLSDPDYREEVYTALVQVATLPSHPLNGDWLHDVLLRLELPDRDRSWTIFCNGDADERRPVEMLIEWAWSDPSLGTDDAVRRLASMCLAWFLTASSRPVRDTTTKALVHLLEGHPDVLTTVLRSFSEVDDPYVTERLLGAVAGVALRSQDDEERVTIGRRVAELTVLSNRWPEHLLSRDYARRAIRAAVASGWDADPALLAAVDPPYPSEWPIAVRTEEQIESLSSPPDYPYGSIRSSLGTLGDFGEKIVRPKVGRFAGLEGTGTGDLVSRRVFDRVLELGWTPERFAWFDRQQHWEPSSGKTIERIGKKYQWIAFRETLGRLADRHQVGGRYTDDPLRPYEDPSDIDARDIDPTVILRESRHAGWEDSPLVWFSPAQADFAPAPFDRWVEELGGLPDPLTLIAPKDDRGESWLTMEGHYQWSEKREPEEEALESPYRRAWYQIRSYLIPEANAEAIESWAAEQDWTGRWMPESAEFHGVLLSDHPYHPSWRSGGPEGNFYDRQEPPGSLAVATSWYEGSGTDYDQSSSDPVRGLVPSVALFELLDARRARDFEWTDETDEIVAADPAVREFGPACLIVRGSVLTRAASDAQTRVLWTILGEKEIVVHDLSARRDYERRWLELTATYLLDGSRLRRISSRARQRRAGVESPPRVEWPLANEGRLT